MYMKIGQRDVVIGIGKNKPWPRKYWACCSLLGREWISPEVIGGGWPGFWQDVPRRFEVYGPTWSFMLALTPGSRWAKMADREIVGLQWIEFKRRDRNERAGL